MRGKEGKGKLQKRRNMTRRKQAKQAKVVTQKRMMIRRNENKRILPTKKDVQKSNHSNRR